MIRVIARKELVETLRDGRFRWMAGVLLALLLVALITGLAAVRDTRRAIESARTAEARTWLGQGERNPHSAAHFGRFAFKPTPMLAYVDRGLDSYLGITVWLEAHRQNPFGLRPAEDRTALQRFGDLTAAFVLQLLVPLFVILLCFGAFASERDSGTLRQLLAAGAKPLSLALGKSLGLTAALSFVLLPAAICAGVLSTIGFPQNGAGDQAARGLLLAGVYLAYALTFVAASLAVSAWARSARTAITVLLCLWVTTTLIVPRLAADVAERSHPTPTPAEFHSRIAEAEANGLGEDGTAGERRDGLRREVLDRYGVETVEELPVDFAGISLQASEEYSNKVFDHFFGELWSTYRAQESVLRFASLASPLLAVRALSMELAGTGLESHRHFADAAEEHRRVFVKYLNDDMTHNAVGQSFSYVADQDVWAGAPPFEYEPPSVAALVEENSVALLVLLSWLAAAALVSWSSCRRLGTEVAS